MALQSLIDEKSRGEAMKTKLPPIVGGDATYHLELRQQLQTIRDKIAVDKFKKDPVNAVVEINARDGRRTAGDLRKTINPLKLSPAVEKQAKAEAQSLLGTDGAASLDVKDFESLNPLTRDSEAQEEGADPNSEARQIEAQKQREFNARNGQSRFNYNEEEKDRLVKNLGIDPGSNEGKMIKECIPCGFRKLSLDDIEFSNPFANTLQDLKDKLENLKKLLGSLLLGNEFEQDLCDLLKMFNAQCIPDLFGIISLFGIMLTKYGTGLDNIWRNALNALIAPFLQPVIGPFTHNLERYVDMITDPLTCVVEALEAQMFKLDAIGAVNNVQAQRRAFNRKKMEFYDRKISALKRRDRAIRSELEDQLNEGELINNSELDLTPLERVDTTKPSSSKIRTFPRYKSTVPFSDKEFDLQRTNADGPIVRGGPSAGTGGEPVTRSPFAWRQSYQEEMDVIARDIAAAETARNKLNKENQNINDVKNNSYNDFYNGVQGSLNDSRERVENANKAIKSIIYQVTTGINQGIQVIRDTLEMYRLELERLITGRVQNQEDQIELARNMQQITRYISIVNAIIKLKKNGWDLEQMCNGGTSTQAMGAFVGAFKTEPSGGDFDFYSATDNNGNELMVVAPGGTKVDVTSVEFDDIGEDDLFGDAIIDDIQNTATFNDLNEADELNRKGVLLDLGNIAEKEITIKLDDAGSEKTDLDLRAENSYVIIKNDFCSKSPIKGTSDTVRQWAENL